MIIRTDPVILVLTHPPKIKVLQINPPHKQPVVHDEFNLIVARERRGQDDLRLSGINHSRVNNVVVLILNMKNILGMINLKQQRVVVNVDNRSLIFLSFSLSYYYPHRAKAYKKWHHHV